MNLDFFQDINTFLQERNVNFHKHVDSFLQELENALNTLLKKDDGYLYIASTSDNRERVYITLCGENEGSKPFHSTSGSYTKDYPDGIENNTILRKIGDNYIIDKDLTQKNKYLIENLDKSLKTNNTWKMNEDSKFEIDDFYQKFLKKEKQIITNNISNNGSYSSLYLARLEPDEQNGTYDLYKFELDNDTDWDRNVQMSILQLPTGIEKNDVLRKINNEFIIDKQATKKIKQETKLAIQELQLEEQEFLKENRKDGDLYQIVSSTDYNDIFWKLKNLNTNEEFSESQINPQLVNKIKENLILKRVNGQYQILE